MARIPLGKLPETTWTVVGYLPPGRTPRGLRARCRVRCRFCGVEREHYERTLKGGDSKSCGRLDCRVELRAESKLWEFCTLLEATEERLFAAYRRGGREAAREWLDREDPEESARDPLGLRLVG